MCVRVYIYTESRKMILMNLVENGCVDTAKEDEGGENWENGIDIYTLSCVKHLVNGKLLNNPVGPVWCHVMI